MSVSGRAVAEQVWDAIEPGTLIPRGFPIAVLVNRFSASAAEIVAACLQDHQLAVVVGERTWGKGSVQNVIEMEQGKSLLKLTTAVYVRPSGKNIHRSQQASESDDWGVSPDDGFEVKFTDDELRKLVAQFDRRDALLDRSTAEPPDNLPADADADNPAETEARGRGIESDRQLEKSLEYLRQRIQAAADSPSGAHRRRGGNVMIVLTLETTCDETAAAVVTGDLQVLSSVVASQEALHQRFRGVVPELAARAHVERILPVVDEALRRAEVRLADLSAIAVANTPGLAGSLLVGLVAAKTICVALGKPLVAINHLHAHVYACRLASGRDVFPCVGFIVSGGHSNLYRCADPSSFDIAGRYDRRRGR